MAADIPKSLVLRASFGMVSDVLARNARGLHYLRAGCSGSPPILGVLSREEAARLIAAARNLKAQTALSVAYGTGLRASEVVSLKVTDIDSQRMTLRVEQGKGR